MRTGDLVVQLTRAFDNRQWKPACWLPLSRWKASTLATIIVEVGKPARWLPLSRWQSQHAGYHPN